MSGITKISKKDAGTIITLYPQKGNIRGLNFRGTLFILQDGPIWLAGLELMMMATNSLDANE